MFRRIDHVAVMVSDMDRSLDFYTKVMGLPVRQRVRLRPEVEIAMLKAGEAELELVCRSGSPAPEVDGKVNHICLAVDDIRAAWDHLTAHGVVFEGAEPVLLEVLGIYSGMFRGPDGERVQIVQHV